MRCAVEHPRWETERTGPIRDLSQRLRWPMYKFDWIRGSKRSDRLFLIRYSISRYSPLANQIWVHGIVLHLPGPRGIFQFWHRQLSDCWREGSCCGWGWWPPCSALWLEENLLHRPVGPWQWLGLYMCVGCVWDVCVCVHTCVCVCVCARVCVCEKYTSLVFMHLLLHCLMIRVRQKLYSTNA